MTNPFPLVMIKWIDSMGCGSWQILKTRSPNPPMKIVTIGWVVHEDAEYIEVTQSYGLADDTHVNNTISIPKIAVLEQMIVPPIKFGD